MTQPGEGRVGPVDPDRDAIAAPAAVAEHYRSIDSAPVKYSVDRPPAAVNAFLVSFAAVSILAMLAMTFLVRAGAFEQSRDIILVTASGERAAIPIRLFVLAYFLTFAFALATNLWRRSVIALQLCGGVLVLVAAVDYGSLALRELGLGSTDVVSQQLASGVLALALFPVVVLRHAQLPPPVFTPLTGRIRARAWAKLFVPLSIAFTIALLVEWRFDAFVAWLREVALLGGIGPGVFLVQQLFTLITAGLGLHMISRSRRATFAPPLAVLVPAHNEAHEITETIEAIDGAAAAYGGPVRLYVVDNVSTDATAAVAELAIAQSQHIQGEVLRCDEPGKAHALNYGLSLITEPFVARVDADTALGERCFDLALRHFADPEVGAVGGMPFPARNETFVDRCRLIEVLTRHGYFQISLMGYEAVLGQPGMFVVFRKSALDEAGPIVRGMNGEDTDICARLNTLGYRSVNDPLAHYYTETPRSWAHLREQRTRWFRSGYHVTARNRRSMLSSTSMAGAVTMPLLLVNSARRAMLTPVLIFALLAFGMFAQTFPTLDWKPIVATVLGLPLLVATMVCLLHRRPRALLYLPGYLVFRLIRSYYTLAAVLSLSFPPLHPQNPLRRSRRRTGVLFEPAGHRDN
ncbi:MAG: glycosyltransferase [Nocardioides sp.]